MKTYISVAASIAVAGTILASCGSSDSDNSTITGSSDVKFTGISTPIGDEQKELRSSVEVTVGGETQSIGFTKLMATNESNNGEIFGASKDYTDELITFEDGSPYICNGTNDGVGSGLDFTSILQKNGKLYMVSQFECQVGSIYKAELEQDATTGDLKVKDNSLEFVSQKEGFGGFVHCAGQTTPWQSHLGSEEYEPDARAVLEDTNATTGLTGNKYYDETVKFWKNDVSKISPYYYGWTPEVTIDANGNAIYTKHYTLGRFSHELSYVMPDKKTVYMSDDGTNVAIFKFVASTAEDLSAGTLYAAKWAQTSATNGGAANISWIKLGSSTNTALEAIVNPDGDIATNDAPKFTDIFESADATEGSCPTGYTSINTSAYHECLKVKSGMETAAAFLESRRYAALKGATTEFRKMEGITYSPENKKLFIAMSALERGMEDNKKGSEADTKYDEGGNNDIKVDYNYCGAVYALDVDDNMNASTMSAIPALIGEMIEKDAEGNSCHLDKISNPDNVTF
ncbi:MAG: DUF839 domain-containing protein, partial [Campylobacterota bacterium]|nr:DUF839 domain-containing protein [Campylobacterota bacterium]